MRKARIPDGALVVTRENILPSRDFAGQVSLDRIIARRPAANGKVIGSVYGTLGEVVMVKHSNDSAAYYCDELVLKTF